MFIILCTKILDISVHFITLFRNFYDPANETPLIRAIYPGIYHAKTKRTTFFSALLKFAWESLDSVRVALYDARKEDTQLRHHAISKFLLYWNRYGSVSITVLFVSH